MADIRQRIVGIATYFGLRLDTPTQNFKRLPYVLAEALNDRTQLGRPAAEDCRGFERATLLTGEHHRLSKQFYVGMRRHLGRWRR
jgi:hypothetical protein